MTLDHTVQTRISLKGAKGIHYPGTIFDKEGYNLTLEERLFYYNTEGLIAFRISVDDMVLLGLPCNTIWIRENDLNRIRT